MSPMTPQQAIDHLQYETPQDAIDQLDYEYDVLRRVRKLIELQLKIPQSLPSDPTMNGFVKEASNLIKKVEVLQSYILILQKKIPQLGKAETKHKLDEVIAGVSTINKGATTNMNNINARMIAMSGRI